MASEKRLIDAKALIALFEKEYKQSTYPYFHMDEIADEIIKAPTVDAVEVVHGRWISIGANRYTRISQCSNCCAKYDFMSNYCPNCGAKMDGERREGE